MPNPTMSASRDHEFMSRALQLAARGRGSVEPNPLVGCVIVRDEQIVGEGFHARFGGPHAEVAALRAAGALARGGTMYVTLEPCCHFGKTPPCTDAVIAAGIARVVAAMRDPFAAVAGAGLQQLQAAGIQLDVGAGADEAIALNSPYLKLLATGRPWVIAKWAMTLDGKIATRSGDSRWISNEASRAVVHELRGRVDAILVGRGTVERDDPLLTARPAGPRVATRVVLDSRATLAENSQLVRSARQTPVLVAVSREASVENRDRLAASGCEVFLCDANTRADRLRQLLEELGRRRHTNVLVEGGAELFGTCFAAREVDEAHVFIAPKFAGGAAAASPIAGEGVEKIVEAPRLVGVQVRALDGDVYVSGRVQRG